MSTGTAEKSNPIGTQLVFEDDRVRVWRIELEPGEEAPFHIHELDYTVVVVDGDMVERHDADGSVRRHEVRPGAFTRWHQSSQGHSLKNVGTKRYRNVIVEVKSLPADFDRHAHS